MQFNSIDFLIFFPIVLLIYFVLPAKVRYIWLLVSSYYFYMCWNPVYSILIALSTVITYLCGMGLDHIKNIEGIEDTRKKAAQKLIIASSLVVNLGILVYFKYTNFLVDSVNHILNGLNLGTVSGIDVLLPVGISFYTFQAVGYTIDVYRGEIKAEKNILKYALFVSFFPQLVAGPIERSKNLLSQIQEEADHKLWDYQRVTSGLMTMLWGFFLKVVIADRISVLVDTIFSEYELYGITVLSLGAVAFAFQIYCDFNGYSTIAIGAAKVLGFDLMENFDTPYFAQSVTEFWRRWHISLSTWFKDYLYIPLGGNRCSKWKRYRNIMITFCVSGLWHGANWTYVFWGGLHGIYQIIEKELSPVIQKINNRAETRTDSFGYRFGKGLLTFCLVSVAWIFFRADTLPHALHYVQRMFTYHDWWHLFDQTIYSLGLDVTEIHILCVSLLLLLAVDLLKYYKKKTLTAFLEEQWIVFRWGVVLGLLFVCLVFGYYGPGYDAAQFIYFQF